MRRPAQRGTRAIALLGLVAVLGSGCSDEEAPDVELGTVAAGEVVATVAAPAVLEPEARVSVTAPATGTVEALLVEDGDRVTAGQALVRLTSPSVELSIQQAEAALGAADALGQVGAVGLDLSPLIRAVREQVDIVVPDLLDALEQQAAALPEGEARDAALARVAESRADYAESAASLQRAEARARSQATQASAAQRAAAEAQRQQAELALDAARSRADDLVITAPRAGVVELARADAGGGAAVPDLPAAGDLGALLGGVTGGGASSAGPIAAGVEVVTGQTLLTLFDLSGFHARASLDEVDAIVVAEGQDVVVLVDAFPEVELEGFVSHVALSPERGETGGVTFPVTVDLRAVPEDVRLRVGLSAGVEIEVDRVASELVVPSSALLRRGGQEVVFVARDGLAVEVPVEVLAIGDDTAAVEGELEAGERIVVRGVETLADGDELP